jgi:hypothetical protein
MDTHMEFVRARGADSHRYTNHHHGIPVMTRQETDLMLTRIESIESKAKNGILVHYEPLPNRPVAREP